MERLQVYHSQASEVDWQPQIGDGKLVLCTGITLQHFKFTWAHLIGATMLLFIFIRRPVAPTKHFRMSMIMSTSALVGLMKTAASSA
jgi:hypothetical protein